MERRKDDMFWRYAPLWAVLLGATNTLAKKALTAYITRRRVDLDWHDLLTAAAVAGISYISFRRSYGETLEGHWFTR